MEWQKRRSRRQTNRTIVDAICVGGAAEPFVALTRTASSTTTLLMPPGTIRDIFKGIGKVAQFSSGFVGLNEMKSPQLIEEEELLLEGKLSCKKKTCQSHLPLSFV